MSPHRLSQPQYSWRAGTGLKTVTFTPTTGRYVRIQATREANGNPWTSASEINLYPLGAVHDPPGPDRASTRTTDRRPCPVDPPDGSTASPRHTQLPPQEDPR